MRRPFGESFPLTQGFGENPASYARFGMKGHNGLDYGCPTGTNILAPHSGKVIEATSDPTGYGNYLKIENDKEGSVLAHLQSFKVKVGDTVAEGQLVGISNNTGNSTGPHLHWGYYTFPRNRQNGYAGFIDQINLITTPPTSDALTACMADRQKFWTERDQARKELEIAKAQIASLKVELKTQADKASRLETFRNQVEELCARLVR